MTDLIAELKALKEKATPGPWEIFADGDLTEITAREKAAVIHWSGFDDSHRDLSGHRSNAALIVAIVNHLPTILAKLEEGERMREALAFYAAPESYQRDIDPDSGCLESQPVIADDGDIARRALAALTPTQESETLPNPPEKERT